MPIYLWVYVDLRFWQNRSYGIMASHKYIFILRTSNFLKAAKERATYSQFTQGKLHDFKCSNQFITPTGGCGGTSCFPMEPSSYRYSKLVTFNKHFKRWPHAMIGTSKATIYKVQCLCNSRVYLKTELKRLGKIALFSVIYAKIKLVRVLSLWGHSWYVQDPKRTSHASLETSRTWAN